jgi:hypothetical protein
VRWLSEHGVFVLVMAGTDEQARRAFVCGLRMTSVISARQAVTELAPR